MSPRGVAPSFGLDIPRPEPLDGDMATGLFLKLLAPLFGMMGFMVGARMPMEEAAFEAEGGAAIGGAVVEEPKIGIQIEGQDGAVLVPPNFDIREGGGGRIEIIPTQPEPEE